MRIKVEIIKAEAGMQVGDTRILNPQLAAELVRLGVAKEIGRVEPKGPEPQTKDVQLTITEL